MSTQHTLPPTFKAYAHRKTGSPSVLEILEFPLQHPTGSNLLVKVYATATNPVDTKVRKGLKDSEGPVDPPRIVGYDGAGTVVAIGETVHKFKIGDEVFFAGNISKNGCNAEYVTIDERIVGRKPKALNWEQAATVPLCALTTWEPLVEVAHYQPQYNLPVENNTNAKKTILIIGGAGGVGSTAIQVAKKVLKFGTVIATASRPETEDWCKQLGADHVIGHAKLKEDLISKVGKNQVDVVFATVDVYTIFDVAIEVVKACGYFIGITAFQGINMSLAFNKRVTVVPEMMFARSVNNEEPEKQGEILDTFANLLDNGVIRHTLNHEFEWSQLKEAHAFQESGKAIGKIGLKVKF